MLLAYGQIPSGARPAGSWPMFSLVGTVPVEIGIGSNRSKKRGKTSLGREISDRKTSISSVSKSDGDFAGASATIIDRSNSGFMNDDEDLMLILQAFIIAEGE